MQNSTANLATWCWARHQRTRHFWRYSLYYAVTKARYATVLKFIGCMFTVVERDLSRTPLVKCLEQEMTPDLLVLSSPGAACILVFRSKASAQLRIEDDTENDCLFESVKRVAAVIKSECPKHAGKQYQTRISKQQALADWSPTLVSLLAQISNNLDRSLSAALIGNIITSFVSKQFTPLQIALSILYGRHHKTIDTLYAYGLTSTYDELRRFKISAASDMVAQQSKLSATFEHRPTDTAVLNFTPHHFNTHSTCRLRQVL